MVNPKSDRKMRRRVEEGDDTIAREILLLERYCIKRNNYFTADILFDMSGLSLRSVERDLRVAAVLLALLVLREHHQSLLKLYWGFGTRLLSYSSLFEVQL